MRNYLKKFGIKSDSKEEDLKRIGFSLFIRERLEEFRKKGFKIAEIAEFGID